jgi:hypothetical protein
MVAMTDTKTKPLISVDLVQAGSFGGPGRSALRRIMNNDRKINGRRVVAVVQSAMFNNRAPHLLAGASLLTTDGTTTKFQSAAFAPPELHGDIGEFLRISPENTAFLAKIGEICRARGLASDNFMSKIDACNTIDIVHFPHGAAITWGLTNNRAKKILLNPNLKQPNYEQVRNPLAAFGVLLVQNQVSGHAALSAMRTWGDTTNRMSHYGLYMFSDHIAGYAYDTTPADMMLST